jgi:hypothetical protein
MRVSLKGVGLAALVGLVAWSCSSITSTGKPLTITLTADRTTAVVDQEVTFSYEATGKSISGILLEFGDGALDSINSYGSQSATGRRTHAYAEAGDYVAVGTVFDFSEGTRSATISVTVTVPPATR